MNPVDAQFIAEINDFLAETGMKPTTFGREMVGDPMLIADLEGGRSPSGRVMHKVRTGMKSHREKMAREAAKAARKKKATA